MASAQSISDGQLANALTEILSGAVAAAIGNGGDGTSNVLNATFGNTSGTLTETVTVKLRRGKNGTPRLFKGFKLLPNETADLLNIPLEADDSLQVQASDPTTVDYYVSSCDGSVGQPQLILYDSFGNLKMSMKTSLPNFFGGGTASFFPEGNIAVQISSAGINPGATAADNVLAAYLLPASSFDSLGRGISITAQGSFGATGNNKRLKIIVNPATAVVGQTVGAGGTTIADTGTVATNGGGWSLMANVFKYGATGSNTQIGLHQQAQIGAAVAALVAPSLITANESGAILVAITGNASTVVSDIVFNFLEINAMG